MNYYASVKQNHLIVKMKQHRLWSLYKICIIYDEWLHTFIETKYFLYTATLSYLIFLIHYNLYIALPVLLDKIIP